MSARRPWAWPLVPLYATGLALKDSLRRMGVLQTRRLQWPVVSVGSLSAGGAGKTPVVIALAGLLRERGWAVDVLSRGYGRIGHGIEQVEAGAAGAATRFGDEPVMIARRAAVPVWVGAERFAAGRESEASGAAAAVSRGVHLLDDGFQHRRLARAMDVVVVTAEDLEDPLLPAGNRREGLRALKRADAVVVREEERELVVPQITGWLRQEAAIWTVRRRIDFAEEADVFHPEHGLIAFSAIARPEGFVEMLRAAGGRVVNSIAFPDHHPYTAKDMHRLTELCRASEAQGFITTEKDAVKISQEMRTQLETTGPLHIARLQAEFLDGAEVIRELEARCG